MIGLIKSEVIKLRTTHVWWGMLLGVVAFTGLALLINCIQAHFAFDNPTAPSVDSGNSVQQQGAQQAEQMASSVAAQAANIFTSGQFFGLLLAMIFGVLIITNEFFHQTATATFLTTPVRSKVVSAKLAAAILWGVIFGLVTAIISIPVGLAFLSSEGQPSHLGDSTVLKSIALNLLGFAIWAIFGLGLGTLLKNQIWAIVIALVTYLGQLVLTGILIALATYYEAQWISDIQYWLPSGASGVMISAVDLTGVPPWWAGALTLFGYGAVAAGLGSLITVRRDIS